MGISFFRPYGAWVIDGKSTHGLRRGLHSCAALRLGFRVSIGFLAQFAVNWKYL
jgi:hypothetical protein